MSSQTRHLRKFPHFPAMRSLSILLALIALFICNGCGGGTAFAPAAGSAQQLLAQPQVLNFQASTGGAPISQTIRLTNLGAVTRTIVSIAVAPNLVFKVKNWIGPLSLAPGKTVQIQLSFAAPRAGVYTGSVVVTSRGSSPAFSGDSLLPVSEHTRSAGLAGGQGPETDVVRLVAQASDASGNNNGGGSQGRGNGNGGGPHISVSIYPASANVTAGQWLQFSANVSGTGNQSVTWHAVFGSIDSQGNYKAPATTTAMQDTVTVVAAADQSVSAAAAVAINPTPTGGYSATNPAPPSVVFYSGNPHSVTTKLLPADIMNHLAPGGDALAVNSITGGTGSGPSNALTVWATPGSDDLATPLFYGQASDPVYNLSSCAYTSNINIQPFHAPANTPYTNPWRSDMSWCDDGNLRVWDQATGEVVGGYECIQSLSPPAPTLGSGGSLLDPASFAVGSGCGAAKSAINDQDWGQPNGWLNTQGAEGSANFAPMAGIVRSVEMASGAINHALILTTSCSGPYNGYNYVFPATAGLWACSSTANMAPIGALLFLDYTDAQIAAMGLPAWQRTLLTAMSHYGAYIAITARESGQGAYFQHESGLPYQLATGGQLTTRTTANGVTGFYVQGGQKDPVFAYLAKQGVACGGTSGTSDCKYVLPWFANIPLVNGTDVTHHIHMADPCVVKSYAGQPGGC